MNEEDFIGFANDILGGVIVQRAVGEFCRHGRVSLREGGDTQRQHVDSQESECESVERVKLGDAVAKRSHPALRVSVMEMGSRNWGDVQNECSLHDYLHSGTFSGLRGVEHPTLAFFWAFEGLKMGKFRGCVRDRKGQIKYNYV